MTVDLAEPAGTRTTVTLDATATTTFPSLPAGRVHGRPSSSQGLADGHQSGADLAPRRPPTLDAAMALAGVAEEIEVTGNLETISQRLAGRRPPTPSSWSTSCRSGRTIREIVDLAPGVHATGPAKSAETGHRQHHDLRRALLREPVPGQRRGGQREPPRPAARPVHRGRHPGDHHRDSPASRPSTAASPAAWSTSSPSRAATSSRARFRTSFTNEDWESETPLGDRPRPDDDHPDLRGDPRRPDPARPPLVLPRRPRLRDRRQHRQHHASPASRSITGRDEQRFEGKLTALAHPVAHACSAPTSSSRSRRTGNFFDTILDLDSLYDRETPQELQALNYTGILTENLFVDGAVLEREFTFISSGSTFTDLINGTLLLDRSRGNARYNSPTFCGVCLPEERDNENAPGQGLLLPVDREPRLPRPGRSATTPSTTSASPTTTSRAATTGSSAPAPSCAAPTSSRS